MTLGTPARLIGLDWGTTTCRAYLVGDGGVVLAQVEAPLGILAVARNAASTGSSLPQAFEAALVQLCGDWLSSWPTAPVLACGMVGSRQGWVEAAYRRLPADLLDDVDLAAVITSSGVTVHVVPGLLVEARLPDVVRGEETQLLGLLGRDAHRDLEQLTLLPGTHSKWLRSKGSTVTDVRTFMTGELFALLTGQGTIAAVAVPADEPDWSAFDGGVDNAMASAGGVGLSGAVFSARTLVLTGQLAPYQVHDYLSGLLIGYELVGVEGAGASRPDTVVVCGEPSLAHRYARALERRGTRVEVLPGDAVATGLWRVAVAAGLVVPA